MRLNVFLGSPCQWVVLVARVLRGRSKQLAETFELAILKPVLFESIRASVSKCICGLRSAF